MEKIIKIIWCYIEEANKFYQRDPNYGEPEIFPKPWQKKGRNNEV